MKIKSICLILILALGAVYPVSKIATAQEAEGEPGFIEMPEAAEEIPGAKVEVSEVDENLISITLEDVEMVDVVSMFTRISGANIIADPTNLVGHVTANLTDVQWKPALETILDMHNLALEEKMPGSGVYSIIVRPPGAPEPMKVETVFLKYAKVDKVNEIIKSMLASGGKVSPFPSRNALVVRSTAANLGEIQQVIEAIDILRDQVFIEAKFMELNDSAIKDIGINWKVLKGYEVSLGSLAWGISENRKWTDTRTDALSRWDKRQKTDSDNKYYDQDGKVVPQEEYLELPPGLTSVATLEKQTTPTRTIEDTIDLGKDITSEIQQAFTKTITDARSAVLGAADFSLVLSALKQMDGVTIVSNPKIIVANEEVAKIHIGQREKPFMVEIVREGAGADRTSFEVYKPGEPVDLGVKLTVTPTINTESNITVKIMPELTRFVRYDIAPDGKTKYPIVATKTIETVFCLESGSTAAIGGLTETTDRDITTKIPLLGDIPLIGKYLFSHTSKAKAQQETIIFVTVGLALPETIQKFDGMPEDTELTHRHLIKSEARRQEFRAELEKVKQAAEAETARKAKKTRSRLLKRRR